MRYPPTITQNVRDIADVEKRGLGARQGPTTIRAGEPGTILRTADGKGYLGRLGTMPDGSMSLALDVSGAVQDIRNPIREADSRITYLDVERKKLDKRVTDNRDSITYLDQNKASQAALNVEAGRITYLDQNKANQSALNVEAGRISAVDRKADSAQSSANSAQSAASNAQSAANSAQSTANSARSEAVNAAAAAVRAGNAAADALSLASRLDAWLRGHTAYPS